MKTIRSKCLLAASALVLGACGSDNEAEGDDRGELTVPSNYEFDSRFEQGESGTSYSGQVLRQVLIAEVTNYVGGLHESIEAGFDTSNDRVLLDLNSYYRFDSDTDGERLVSLDTGTMEPVQSTLNDISSGKDLVSKIAGNDGGDRYHRDFTSDFIGWRDEGLAQYGGAITSPDGFVQALFSTLNANAIAQEANGPVRTAPDGQGGTVTLQVHQTETGLDLKQLVQKFLTVAVSFSQGADDYLDEGLESDNTEPADGEEPFTELEHAWDEGFGYFGAARNYFEYDDAQIADGVVIDADGDGKCDLTREFNFGASVNAAKRDVGASSGTVDLTQEAMDAFLRGRAIISYAEGELSDELWDQLIEQRDIAVSAWERAIAATVVHYVNEVSEDYEKLGTDDYDFSDHAKHWSELKGFALGLQFSPHTPLSKSDFRTLHSLLGDQPLLGDAEPDALDDYTAALIEARDILEDAYGFESEDVDNW